MHSFLTTSSFSRKKVIVSHKQQDFAIARKENTMSSFIQKNTALPEDIQKSDIITLFLLTHAKKYEEMWTWNQRIVHSSIWLWKRVNRTMKQEYIRILKAKGGSLRRKFCKNDKGKDDSNNKKGKRPMNGQTTKILHNMKRLWTS